MYENVCGGSIGRVNLFCSLKGTSLTRLSPFPIIQPAFEGLDRRRFSPYKGDVGAWLSLVERSVRDREVGGSNPLAPTKNIKKATCYGGL